MTAPTLTATSMPVQTLAHYGRLQQKFHGRHQQMGLIHQVRQGNITQMFPAELNFSLTFHGSPIANFVDIVARDMAEGIAPLPALQCVSGRMQTEADKVRAETKNHIGAYYWRYSRLETQMLRAADQYVSYGFSAIFIEPDVDKYIPYICIEDPRHSVYELDRFGRCRVYARKWRKTVDNLCAQFPELASRIRYNPTGGPKGGGGDDSGDTELEMVRWVDDKRVTLFLPQRQGLVLQSYAHKMSCTPVVIVERPGEDDTPRGQFDDVMWVQLARAIYSALALEGAANAVQAPIAVPSDMDQFPVGPHAILQSDNAQAIHRVDLNIPQTAFAEAQALDNELRVGSRYPDARSGNVATSQAITGKGMQALLGTFSAQIQGAQMVWKQAFQDATAIAFEMDETWWPNESKRIEGTVSGFSYEFNYTPSKDINGRYSCTVTYGFATGMQDPSQAIVTLLQLEGAGLIAKGTTQDNLPFALDQIQEKKKINIEKTQDAMQQALFGYMQATGQLAAQGQDVTPIIQLGYQAIQEMQNGRPVEQAILDGFMAMEQQKLAQQQAQMAAQQAQGPAGPGGPGGPEAPEQTPGQEGLPPSGPGRPTMEQMIAGFRGNGTLPVNQLEVRRQVPTGT